VLDKTKIFIVFVWYTSSLNNSKHLMYFKLLWCAAFTNNLLSDKY